MASVATNFPDLLKEEFQQPVRDAYNSNPEEYDAWIQKCMKKSARAHLYEMASNTGDVNGLGDEDEGDGNHRSEADDKISDFNGNGGNGDENPINNANDQGGNNPDLGEEEVNNNNCKVALVSGCCCCTPVVAGTVYLVYKYLTGDRNPETGTMLYSNGDIYKGAWKDGRRHGQGKMEYHNGVVYVGEWIEDHLPCNSNDYNGLGGKLFILDDDITKTINDCQNDEVFLFDFHANPESEVKYGSGRVVFKPQENNSEEHVAKIIYANGIAYEGEVEWNQTEDWPNLEPMKDSGSYLTGEYNFNDDGSFLEYLRTKYPDLIDDAGHLRRDIAANFEELDLSEGDFTQLNELQYFTKLKKLNCSDNQLESFPAGLPDGLIFLDISDNELSNLPLQLLPQGLENLYISDNKISTLPNLQSLEKLNHLHCSHNSLTEILGLPDGLQKTSLFA